MFFIAPKYDVNVVVVRVHVYFVVPFLWHWQFYRLFDDQATALRGVADALSVMDNLPSHAQFEQVRGMRDDAHGRVLHKLAFALSRVWFNALDGGLGCRS